jgi:hypothetical protein
MKKAALGFLLNLFKSILPYCRCRFVQVPYQKDCNFEGNLIVWLGEKNDDEKKQPKVFLYIFQKSILSHV